MFIVHYYHSTIWIQPTFATGDLLGEGHVLPSYFENASSWKRLDRVEIASNWTPSMTIWLFIAKHNIM